MIVSVEKNEILDVVLMALEQQVEIYKSPEYAYPHGCILSRLAAERCMQIVRDIKEGARKNDH